MKKNGHEGFVMAEVLITVMIVMVFGTLLFSSASRRYARAERNIAKMEARLAAESVVQVLAGKILKEESSEVIEKLVSRHGLPVTEGVVWADTENGESEKIRTVVTSELVLHAECTVREQTESASIVLGRERLSVYTPSTADRKEENAP